MNVCSTGARSAISARPSCSAVCVCLRPSSRRTVSENGLRSGPRRCASMASARRPWNARSSCGSAGLAGGSARIPPARGASLRSSSSLVASPRPCARPVYRTMRDGGSTRQPARRTGRSTRATAGSEANRRSATPWMSSSSLTRPVSDMKWSRRAGLRQYWCSCAAMRDLPLWRWSRASMASSMRCPTSGESAITPMRHRTSWRRAQPSFLPASESAWGGGWSGAGSTHPRERSANRSASPWTVGVRVW